MSMAIGRHLLRHSIYCDVLGVTYRAQLSIHVNRKYHHYKRYSFEWASASA